jgi:hypothetical protein
MTAQTPSCIILLLALLSGLTAVRGAEREQSTHVGREVAVPVHLQDGAEFRLPLPELPSRGKKLFSANWAEQDGGGRPLTKGTGRPLSDPTPPLKDARAFSRISGPDSNSCAGCHQSPYGIPVGGDFVANVVVLGHSLTFPTVRQRHKLPARGVVDETGQAASHSQRLRVHAHA